MAKKRHFRVWYLTLAVTLVALAYFVYLLLQTLPTMEAQDNPFAAIGILMVYAVYWGWALIIAIVAGIITIILAVKKI
jgi:hypothetical protein